MGSDAELDFLLGCLPCAAAHIHGQGAKLPMHDSMGLCEVSSPLDRKRK